MFPFASRVVRDDRLAASVPEQGAEPIAVIGGIGQAASRAQVSHQGGGDRNVAPMPRAENQAPGAAVLIDRRMEFGRAPAPRPPDRLLLCPPFPPPAAR